MANRCSIIPQWMDSISWVAWKLLILCGNVRISKGLGEGSLLLLQRLFRTLLMTVISYSYIHTSVIHFKWQLDLLKLGFVSLHPTRTSRRLHPNLVFFTFLHGWLPKTRIAPQTLLVGVQASSCCCSSLLDIASIFQRVLDRHIILS